MLMRNPVLRNRLTPRKKPMLRNLEMALILLIFLLAGAVTNGECSFSVSFEDFTSRWSCFQPFLKYTNLSGSQFIFSSVHIIYELV